MTNCEKINPERRILAKYWLEKADESLRAAQLSLTADMPSIAVNRLYYAVFYAASAFMAARGMDYGKHSAVQAAVHRNLIKTCLMPREMGQIYGRLFNARQDGDYKAFAIFEVEEVNEELAPATEFINRIRELLEL